MAKQELYDRDLLYKSMDGLREALEIYGGYVWPGPGVFCGEIIYGRILDLNRYVNRLINNTS